MSDAFAQPLAGIRVLDLTSVLFGPYATQLLGDFGADVIKIEAPAGDPTRGIGPQRHRGMAAGFLGCNRNKRSVCLDLKRESARAALWQLIDGADMFVHNIRPQKIAKLGFTPDAVMAAKPDIVYGAFHGYLEDGPYAGRPAYDDIIQGECGIAAAFLERDGTPAFVPSVVADKSSGLIAANGLMAALFQRLRTGKGVYMEIGMFECMSAYTLLEHQFGTVFAPPDGDPGYSRVISPERRPYAASDGHICMLAYTDAHWRAFWTLAGMPEAADDPRFATLSNRTGNIDALYQKAGEAMRRRSRSEWLTLLRQADIPCGPVNTFAELRQDPQLEAMNLFRRYDHPSEGELEILDPGLRFDRSALPIRRHQPRLGEHSETVLAEAGLSDAEIADALGRN